MTELKAAEGNSDLESLIGYNLKRAYVIVQEDFRKTLGEGGLSPRSFAALSLVISSPKITQSALARALGVERSGMVAIIDDLQHRELLERAGVPGDKRAQALLPTANGKRIYKAALAAVAKHEEKLFGVFNNEEQALLVDLLRRFREARGNGVEN